MLSELDFKQDYLPYTENTPETFFRQAISQSIFYRRASGFFSSSIFNLFTLEFLDFAKKGGKIELICSNQLSSDDATIILEKNGTNIPFNNFLSELEAVSSDALAFFSTLLKYEILNIKIAKHSTGGIFHDKTGVFYDSHGNSVSFRGSSNETFMGWSVHGNFETLECFCSWREKDSDRVINHQIYLESVWNNDQPHLSVISLPNLYKEMLIEKSREDFEVFRPVLEEQRSSMTTTSIMQIMPLIKRPLKPFQSETLANWAKNGFHGIIKHATGSGKTVTAISAIREHIMEGKPSLIVVPSSLLLQQWKTEVLVDIPTANILLCGDGNISWKNPGRLRSLLSNSSSGFGAIIIGVLDTVVSELFLSKLKNLTDLLLVTDEAHTLGSTQAQKLLSFNFGKKLGLSATPERFRDEEGTKKILDYFHGILDPQISIFDAIKNGRLVNYLYFPTAVELDEDEMKEWKRLTLQIIRLGYKGEVKTSKSKLEQIRKIFLQRSRISKKAQNKISAAVSIIRKNFKYGEYWLVYCEDSEQLAEINEALLMSGHSPHIYKTDMIGSKAAELSDYVRRGGIMLSIRCLDEGIDIPRISHAVIIASSQNPRQFVQRRGRVLRVDGVKDKAVIYDLFTTPNVQSETILDSLLRSELQRAKEFADSALNKVTALTNIRKILLNLGVDINELMKEETTEVNKWFSNE